MNRYEKNIQLFTEAIVTTLGRNFKRNLEDGGIDKEAPLVNIYPPRWRDCGP